MSDSDSDSNSTRYCSRCKHQVPLQKFSKKKDGTTYFKQCDYHRKKDRLYKRRDYCFKKLEGITEEDAIREPHSLDSLIFMVQEVRYFLGDRINVVEARLDCLEASNKKREI
jgi:hypothetical protein